MGERIPEPGQWPIDPQEDQPIAKERIWVDGCFDFAHHGHAGALLQARQRGTELLVGIHSDEEILENKGPTVMSLAERVAAAEACRWVTKTIPHAPYVTYLSWITHYGCWYVVHGDDITSDAGGEDCYRHVKNAGRFLVVKRTPSISTTDLVGRMLLYTKGHFIKSFKSKLMGSGDKEGDSQEGRDMLERIQSYATDETGKNPGAVVWLCEGLKAEEVGEHAEVSSFEKLVSGNDPAPGQRIVYVDGGFDLFSSGHIAFLKKIYELEGGKAYVVAGVHDDEVINHWKGLNYPIMNIFERGLCVLQCKYINAVVFGAPFSPSKSYLDALPVGKISTVYHGPTAFMPLTYDPYIDAKEMGIFSQIGNHDFQHVNAGEIVERIMKSRAAFEERQRRKGAKATVEEAARAREIEEAAAKETAETAARGAQQSK